MEEVAITLFPFRALAGLLEGSRRPAIGQGSGGSGPLKLPMHLRRPVESVATTVLPFHPARGRTKHVSAYG
jgi:hypothetical protein